MLWSADLEHRNHDCYSYDFYAYCLRAADQSIEIMTVTLGLALAGSSSKNGDIIGWPTFFSALVTMGVMRPLSVATATEMSQELNWRTNVSCQLELHSGTFMQDNADAFKMKSLTDNFGPPETKGNEKSLVGDAID